MGRVCLAILLAAACGAEDLLASLLAMPPEQRGPALQARFLSPPRTWSADEARVAEWLDRLAGSDHLIRIELGVDGRRQVALAAGSGTWWDQVRQLCEAGKLVPAPTRPVVSAPPGVDDEDAIHMVMRGGQAMLVAQAVETTDLSPGVLGGPLRLRQRETPDPLLLDGGEVLVEVRERRLLGYHSHRLEERIFACRLLVHLDPHAPWDLVASSRLVWDQLTADDGTALQRLGPGGGEDRLREALLPPLADSALLRCGSLPAGCRSITCNGRVELRCQGMVVLDQVLEPGPAQDLVSAPFPFSSQLVTRRGGPGPDGATHVLTLRYQCAEALENPAPLLSDPQGHQARIVNRNTRRDGESALVVLDLALPGDGPWRLHCKLPIALPTVSVPVRCELPLP